MYIAAVESKIKPCCLAPLGIIICRWLSLKSSREYKREKNRIIREKERKKERERERERGGWLGSFD